MERIAEHVVSLPQERIQERRGADSGTHHAAHHEANHGEGVLKACQLSLESASMIGSWRNRRGGPDHSPEAHLGASCQVVDVPRVGRRTVEQHVELPPPQSTEELVEVVIEVPQQLVQGRTVEQVVTCPVSWIVKEVLALNKVFLLCTVEQAVCFRDQLQHLWTSVFRKLWEKL